MLGLLIIAVIGGRMLRWLIFSAPDIICLPNILKLLTLIVCICGAFLGYIISNSSLYFTNKTLSYYNLRVFVGSIWFIPMLSSLGTIYYPLNLGIRVTKSFDQGWSEYFGGQHLYTVLKYFSSLNQFMQNNNLKIYLLSFVIWIIVLVSLMIL
jgi:NADH-ubiquinone oxidoreductase chain 5